MSDERYNGWSNWDTWNVVLWIDNDECLYHEKIRWLRRTPTISAQSVEQFVRDELFIMFSCGTTPDRADLNAVDWDEIADVWLAEYEGDNE